MKKYLEDRISRGKITNSSENVFEVETHRTQNISVAQKRDKEKFFFTKEESKIFNSPKYGIFVRCVFNNANKEYIEEIYNMKWELIYSKN